MKIGDLLSTPTFARLSTFLGERLALGELCPLIQLLVLIVMAKAAGAWSSTVNFAAGVVLARRRLSTDAHGPLEYNMKLAEDDHGEVPGGSVVGARS